MSAPPSEFQGVYCFCCKRRVTITQSVSEHYRVALSYNQSQVFGTGKTIAAALRSAHENLEAVTKLLKK